MTINIPFSIENINDLTFAVYCRIETLKNRLEHDSDEDNIIYMNKEIKRLEQIYKRLNFLKSKF